MFLKHKFIWILWKHLLYFPVMNLWIQQTSDPNLNGVYYPIQCLLQTSLCKKVSKCVKFNPVKITTYPRIDFLMSLILDSSSSIFLPMSHPLPLNRVSLLLFLFLYPIKTRWGTIKIAQPPNFFFLWLYCKLQFTERGFLEVLKRTKYYK